MPELATLAATFLAFALLHGAEPRRRPAGLRAGAPLWRHASRVLSLALLSFSVAAWVRIESVAAALLVVLTMFSAAGMLFVLAVAAFPRLTWSAAYACASALLVLAALGGFGD